MLVIETVKDGHVYEWRDDVANVAEELIGYLFEKKHNGSLPWDFIIIAHNPAERLITIRKCSPSTSD